MTKFNIDNQNKNISGKSAKDLIGKTLIALATDLDIDMIITPSYSIGYPNQQKQFKMDYKITFPTRQYEQWLIKSTNSIRERIYGTEFFAQNIRIIDEKISNIFVVVPDSIPSNEKRNLKNYSDKIKSSDYTSFLTDVITVNELRNKIITIFSENISQGIKANILGKDAEKEIVKLLNSDANKNLWNNYEANRHSIKSATFDIFKDILTKSGLNETIDKIESIVATDKIPLLSNNGKPKTDVSFTLVSKTESVVKNISVKNSTSKTVTVHEGKAEDLIKVLNLESTSELAKAIKLFEYYGSEKYLKENYPNLSQVLNQELCKYNKQLVDFFVFGTNSPLVCNQLQVADLLVYTTNFATYEREKYIVEYINKFSEKGQFGTPFKWTYPSKKRGQRIQIKGFTNN